MVGRRVVLMTVRNPGYVGPPLARLLARSGHDFVLFCPRAGPGSNRLDRESSELIDELGQLGVDVEPVSDVDLTTAEGNQALVDAAISRFGRLDAACYFTGSFVSGDFLAATREEWEVQKTANIDSVFYALRAALPPMIDAGYGQILVFTSAIGARPEPQLSLYAASRAGANALVRAVGVEYAASGVVINAIGTNFMDTPGFRASFGADEPGRRAELEALVPLGRLGTAEEVAEFAAVLLDGRSRFQTGQFFSMSGGWSA